MLSRLVSGLKRNGFYIVFTFLITFSAQSSAERVDIATFEYLPYTSSVEIPGKGRGFAIDVAHAAFDTVGIETNFLFYPLNRSHYLEKSGRSYATLGVVTESSPAAKSGEIIPVKIEPLRFVFLYFHNELGKISYRDISDLTKFSIGNVQGSITSKLLYDEEITVDWSVSIEQNLNKFAIGRFDLCVAEEKAALHLIKEQYPDLLSKISSIDFPHLSVAMSMNFSKDRSDLSEKFAEGLELIRANGSYQDIYDRYFYDD